MNIKKWQTSRKYKQHQRKIKKIDKELNQKFKQIELSSEINKILKTLDEYKFLPDVEKK